MISRAEGFSNIALIKYMGKTDASANQASNPSLSYTLPHLKSVVEVSNAPTDSWELLEGPGLHPMTLSEKGRAKFMRHVQTLKEAWGVKGGVLVKSANNFPADCGIASSASSFAALTQAMANHFARQETPLQLARLSRLGSGSSCRSFFSPWCLWNGDQIEKVDLPQLLHFVVIVNAEKKQVSSSEAHLRVATSPRFEGRAERVQKRMETLLSALKRGEWTRAYEVTADEFEDMHRLFETSEPSFTYRTQASFDVIEDAKKIWNYKKDGPLITMDAGANVHMLFRPDQRNYYDKLWKHYHVKYPVIGNEKNDKL